MRLILLPKKKKLGKYQLKSQSLKICNFGITCFNSVLKTWTQPRHGRGSGLSILTKQYVKLKWAEVWNTDIILQFFKL